MLFAEFLKYLNYEFVANTMQQSYQRLKLINWLVFEIRIFLLLKKVHTILISFQIMTFDQIFATIVNSSIY